MTSLGRVEKEAWSVGSHTPTHATLSQTFLDAKLVSPLLLPYWITLVLPKATVSTAVPRNWTLPLLALVQNGWSIARQNQVPLADGRLCAHILGAQGPVKQVPRLFNIYGEKQVLT